MSNHQKQDEKTEVTTINSQIVSPKLEHTKMESFSGNNESNNEKGESSQSSKMATDAQGKLLILKLEGRFINGVVLGDSTNKKS